MRPRLRLLAPVVLALASSGPGCDSAPPPAGGSTVQRSWADPDGDGVLEPAPGLPLLDRTDLAPAGPVGHQVALLAQITDAHVRDEESPARVAFLDRLGPPFHSTFRPHEALSLQVLAASVRAVDRLAPDAVVTTGDLVDNAQGNELAQASAVLRGGPVRPDSGAAGYDGPQAALNPDPFYYRPDVDAPRHPGLLERAQRPFVAPGLHAPWFAVAGNHDLLAQGEIPATARTQAVAAGPRAVIELPARRRLPRRGDATLPELVDRFLARGLPGGGVRVPSDARRRSPGPRGAAEVLRRASGGQVPGGARLDYSFDVGADVRGIVLDTVRREGGSGGEVRAQQLAWLRGQLRRAGQRWVIVFSHHPLDRSAGGSQALALLDASSRVVAAVAGHTHRNRIVARRSPAGGYWLIGTASLADFPQQARALRLVSTPTGVALETWMVDSAPDPLADLARQLAHLDAQGGRPRGFAGRPGDGNVRLHLRRGSVR